MAQGTLLADSRLRINCTTPPAINQMSSTGIFIENQFNKVGGSPHASITSDKYSWGLVLL